MRELVLILDNIRSAYNVGALLRTADGLAVSKVYMTGYTPYPKEKNDTRLPHISRKQTLQIDKTSLGASQSVNWKHETDINALIKKLKEDGYMVATLEQDQKATLLGEFTPPDKLALIAGNEVEGVAREVIDESDIAIEIPMLGKKESFNVAVATAMALYHCRFFSSTD